MKQKIIFLPIILFAGVPLLGIGSAQASSELTSFATVTFTIDSINNLTTPGLISPSDFGIFADFEQDNASYVNLSGDAAINDNNPAQFGSVPLITGTQFSHTFSITGSVNNGTFESYHLGLYGLSLLNSGLSDTYAVDLSFSYLLSASATGQNADTDVNIDYFSDEDPAFVGSDYVNHANIFGFPVTTATNAKGFSMTLAPGEAGYYLADVVIKGNLMAAPVPLPAAAWSFLAGLLGILGLKRRNPTTSEKVA